MSQKNRSALWDTCPIRVDGVGANLFLVIRSSSNSRGKGKTANLICASLALIWLSLPLAPTWALGGREGDWQSVSLGLRIVSEQPESLGGALLKAEAPMVERLQFTLGRHNDTKVRAFANLGRMGFLPSGLVLLGFAGAPAPHNPTSSFSPEDRALDAAAPENVERVDGAAGARTASLTGKWDLAPGGSLTSSYSLHRNDNPGDEKRGLSSVDLTHTFAVALGASSRFQANVNEHRETWDQPLGRPAVERNTSSAEIQSKLGMGDLRMALTLIRAKEGELQKSEVVREIHWNLAPGRGLQFNADYTAKKVQQGREQRTQSVAAVMQLAPGTELGASVKALSAEDGGKRESTLKLNTSLGGGASAVQLTAQRVLTKAAKEADSKRVLDMALTGGLGVAEARTNLTARMHEERAMAPDGTLARVIELHADRSFGSRLKLTVDREEKANGTAHQLDRRAKSVCTMDVQLDGRSKLVARLESQRSNSGRPELARDMTFEHQARLFLLRARQQLWRQDASRRSVMEYAVDAPSGQLPDWAKDVSHGHQFADARDYLIPQEPGWADLPFAGTRIWGRQYQGGAEGELRSLGWAHRRMAGERYHLVVAYQSHPEAEDGDNKGRPLPLRRRLVEVNALVAEHLVAQARYSSEEGSGGPEFHRQAFTFGLRGQLSQQEQLEASISQGASTGDGQGLSRTSISLMYALKVSDEHRVSVKAGYAWGDNRGDHNRNHRLTVDYSKPI